jgi:hypothetical protein
MKCLGKEGNKIKMMRSSHVTPSVLQSPADMTAKCLYTGCLGNRLASCKRNVSCWECDCALSPQLVTHFPPFAPESKCWSSYTSTKWVDVLCVSGANLFYVAVHEFGHALGLHHSNVTESVMYPLIPMYDPAFRLHSEDIQYIQVTICSMQQCMNLDTLWD